MLAAVFAAGGDDDLVRLLARTDAVTAFLGSPDGADLLAGAKRAANILRIEDKKDGPHDGAVDPSLLGVLAEHELAGALDRAVPTIEAAIAAERFSDAMRALAQLRTGLDAFFDHVTVNDPDPALRRNRLRLLSRVGAAMRPSPTHGRQTGARRPSLKPVPAAIRPAPPAPARQMRATGRAGAASAPAPQADGWEEF